MILYTCIASFVANKNRVYNYSNYNYGHVPGWSTYTAIYRMYNPIYNQL